MQQHWRMKHEETALSFMCPFPQCNVLSTSTSQFTKHLQNVHRQVWRSRTDVVGVLKEVGRLVEKRHNPHFSGMAWKVAGEQPTGLQIPRGARPFSEKDNVSEDLRRFLVKNGLVKWSVLSRLGKIVPVSPVRSPVQQQQPDQHQLHHQLPRRRLPEVLKGGELHQLLTVNQPRAWLASDLQFTAHQLYKESARRVEVDALQEDNEYLRQDLTDWESGVRWKLCVYSVDTGMHKTVGGGNAMN